MLTVFYGMSGTLKYTTMTWDPRYKDNHHILSDIKHWMKYQRELFKDNHKTSDLDLACKRLIELGNPRHVTLSRTKNVSVERGITDFLFHYLSRPEQHGRLVELEEGDIRYEETRLLRIIDPNIHKVLLVMKDKEFIES